MKSIIVKAVLLFLFLSGGSPLSRANCGPRISPFVDGHEEERLQRIVELHDKGKEVIPLLIAEIGNHEIAPVVLANMFSSQMPMSSPVYCGTVAAYLIELILGNPNLSLKALSDDRRLMLGGGPDNYVYVSGCIVESSTMNPIEGKSLLKVRNIYSKWWRDNSVKSLIDLRSDWQKGVRPLSGSRYRWY